ncbi:MAG: HlyD family efflux transporter periplasmic adaptor subunit [Campylobacterales bacterium]
MSHYRPFVIAGVLLLLAAAAIVNALYQRELPDNLIAQAGRIDGDLIVLNAKYPGRLTMLNADEGDRVEANATVAQLDDRETLAKIRAADAKIRALESRLEADKLAYKIAKAALPSRYRSAYENIEVAEAALNAAEEQIRRQKLVVEQERKDYERAESLLSQHLIKAHDVELRRLAYESETQGLKTLQQQKRQARQRVRIAKEQTEAAKADVTKIEMAAAQVTADRAQIEAAAAARDELRLVEETFTIKALRAGVIIDRIAQPGEMVAAGGGVVSMIDPDSLYLKLYIDTLQNGKVSVGDSALIYLDGAPDHPIKARVVRISAQAEFTPREVNVKNVRIQRMYAVRLKPLEPMPQIKLGLPAIGVISIDGNGLPPDADLIENL